VFVWEPSSLTTIGAQMPHLHHGLCVHPTNACWAGRRQMTAQFHKTTDEEFESQMRNLLRLVSVCTLGLWSFSAGLLIGIFYLF
jgi:hypothetical protein